MQTAQTSPDFSRSRPRTRYLALTLLLLAMPSSSQAAHLANHLVITEVAADTYSESAPNSAEFIEIFNPTDQTIVLNAGAVPGTANGLGSYFIADYPDYYKIPGGKVASPSGTSDGIYQFPAGTTIPPKGIVVVTANSTTFLNDFFASFEDFKALPGSPQLFETVQDGTADGVPDMLIQSTYSSGSGTLGFTNGGEPVILYYWDGQSDLIQDVDILVWGSSSNVIKKSTTTTFDGPDAGEETSAYKNDAGQTSSLQGGPASSNVDSLQRRNIEEPREADSGGNGITGQDETSERWDELDSTTSNPTWSYENFTPGVPLLRLDGPISDAISWLTPAAVSTADGSTGDSSPLDYSADGTLTELYLYPVDTTDSDRLPDALYVAVRGEFFSEPEGTQNASLVLFDFDPGTGSGVNTLFAGNQLNDTTGTLDTHITRAGVTLLSSAAATFGFDGAMGIDTAAADSSDVAGWRTWGTGGASGTTSDFAYIDDDIDVMFYGDLNELYGGASSTRISARDGFEGVKRLTKLAGQIPSYIWVVAVTTAENSSGASPNTLPESTGDDLSTYPQVLDAGVCFQPSTGKAFQAYVDVDGDGYGAAPYCGPDTSGLASRPGDCNDSSTNVNPGKTEVCDGIDNDCDGQTDEGGETTYYEDADLDGYGDTNASTRACSAPAGYITVGGDCDDDDDEVNPGELEVCDDKDNDCNNSVDDGLTTYSLYVDKDGDAYGTGTAITDCDVPPGYAMVGGDCDDNDETLYPGATEVCDQKDNDCDTQTDEGVQSTFYRDADSDGVGGTSTTQACSAPTGYVASSGDCDDNDANTRPGASELCDGKDNNCDSAVPANEADADRDGKRVCENDCDDNDSTVYPGASELCDGKDNDCASGVPADEADADKDGVTVCGGDCNDNDAAVNPNAEEICDDVDNDCNAETDEKDDFDEDGVSICQGDCDDENNAIKPGATEVCDDNIDNDCDDAVDTADSTCGGDDDDTTGDDDDTSGDDDDDTTGDDDDTSGDDDDDTPGDDDDDTPGDDDSDSGDCQCDTSAGERPVPAGTLLLGLVAGGLMFIRTRRR